MMTNPHTSPRMNDTVYATMWGLIAAGVLIAGILSAVVGSVILIPHSSPMRGLRSLPGSDSAIGLRCGYAGHRRGSTGTADGRSSFDREAFPVISLTSS